MPDNKIYTLKEYYQAEIIRKQGKKFSWIKVLQRASSSRRYNYLFWFRIADILYRSDSRLKKSLARKINKRLMNKYSVEIMLGANIDIGLAIGHACGIVVTKKVVIGKNFTILQNTTIGDDGKSSLPIKIGDNVFIGANSCIVGSDLSIGNNVTFGAMSFVNKDVPCDATYITRKESLITRTA